MSLAGRLVLALLLWWPRTALPGDSVLVPSPAAKYMGGGPQGGGLAKGNGPGLLLRQGEGMAGAAAARPSRLRPALFWSAGLALAAGGTAWWSSRRADRAYDRYLHSAGPQRQDQALRQARHYDRVAGGAFVLMEAGIVLSTYLVFF